MLLQPHALVHGNAEILKKAWRTPFYSCRENWNRKTTPTGE